MFPAKYYSDNKIQGEKMDWASNMHGKEAKYTRFWQKNLTEREH
jgi:hypothetical protein